MLILSRKLNESIVIDGRIIVKVLRIASERPASPGSTPDKK